MFSSSLACFVDLSSPINPEAKRSYDRNFLMNLQFVALSKRPPDGMPILNDILQAHPVLSADTRGSMSSGRGNDFYQRQVGLLSISTWSKGAQYE